MKDTVHSPQTRQALLADDDYDIRMILENIIQSFGFDVTCAENGSRALELYELADGRFDLLLTDICMPKMNGCELIRAIRQQDQQLPIIAITGFTDLDIIKELEPYHVRLFEKPINFKALHTYIDALHIGQPPSETYGAPAI